MTDGAAIEDSIRRPERFGAVFDRHYTAVHRYLSRRTPREHAEDLTSLTFVIAFERRRSFRSSSDSALPWLLGIATNLLYERARRHRRELGTIVRLNAERSPGQSGDEEISLAPGLSEALASLDRSQLDVLLLYAWEELSYEEIADALDVPVGTVRSRLSRARERLRSQLQQPPSAAIRPDLSQEIS